MQITNLLGLCLLAMTASAAAMPRFAGPYHGERISVHVPTNATTPHNATTTGIRGKAPLSTGLSKAKNGTGRNQPAHASHSPQKADIPLNSNIPNHIKHINHCHELCSLESQTCTIAMPDEDEYCSKTYKQCIAKCHPSDFE
ncbi:hypothetical protein N7532_011559 [Penicillium argentinense]|uniref:Uncharacterized protein n=1 Tax=Penicillium argentinense TaxID=1131581 RepID=A0A9W9JV47_9EURO|nr:uncharacterized protein N7532_011559 [Penicillium argentinense]KAJ5082516.1 hypothetical protein N7532_011559 [Penicillium argentinense]